MTNEKIINMITDVEQLIEEFSKDSDEYATVMQSQVIKDDIRIMAEFIEILGYLL